MAKDITIEVAATLTVSDEMADRCLALLEWWQDDHPEQRLTSVTSSGGSTHIYREPRK